MKVMKGFEMKLRCRDGFEEYFGDLYGNDSGMSSGIEMTTINDSV